MTSQHIISVEELGALVCSPSLRILDASWYLPADKRQPREEYLAAHIPGAVFFDVDAISDKTAGLPHTLASEEEFTAAARGLGLNNDDTIVVYDTAGLFSAARVWWNLRLAGAISVRVLNGGFPAWLAAGYSTEKGTAEITPGNFTARYDRRLVHDFAQMLELVQSGNTTIVDAPGGPRFVGSVGEARHGLASGHITGSRNVPYSSLLNEKGLLKSREAIVETFAKAGVDIDTPIVATCGSGVTAGIVALALATLGRTRIPIYDGSWAEWGSRKESAPFIATGPA